MRSGAVGGSRAAGLFICECYIYGRAAPCHPDCGTIVSGLPALQARRMILAHMGPLMLSGIVGLVHDGLVADL